MCFKLEEAKPHTIKKFEIIDAYVNGWARKLLGYNGRGDSRGSKGVIYIDCMSNAGMYIDENGNEVEGTALRVARTLNNIVRNYPNKEAVLFFNDYDQAKIDTLINLLKQHKITHENNSQITIFYSCGDRDEFIKKLDPLIRTQYNGYNTLLLYDPYNATLNWDAITPFINRWGEVIINHMVSDTARGARQAKKESVKKKYQETYQQDIDNIIAIGTDKIELDKLIVDIIKNRADSNYKTYIASFPFFNRKNGLLYNLIFCTHNEKGIRLFKKTAWDSFGGKSSMKKVQKDDGQLMITLDGEIIENDTSDEDCYYVSDIAKYIYETFKGLGQVSNETVKLLLDKHPVFPSEGYILDIRNELKRRYNAEVRRDGTIIFGGK